MHSHRTSSWQGCSLLLLVLCSLLCITPLCAATRELTVGTYNVCVGTANERDTAAVVSRMRADLVVLQEVSAEFAPQLSKKLASAYPYREFAGDRGLGVVSRYPITRIRAEASKLGNNGFLFVTINVGGRPVQIVDLHLDPLRTWTLGHRLTLPWQFVVQAKVQWSELDQVLPRLRRDVPTILLGDFNRATDGAINRLQRLGYVDSFAEVTPQADRVPTLHYNLLALPMTKRIDFIFHDRHWTTKWSAVVGGRPSDHDALVSRLSPRRQ